MRGCHKRAESLPHEIPDSGSRRIIGSFAAEALQLRLAAFLRMQGLPLQDLKSDASTALINWCG